jgi:hypothetical protein
MTTLSNSCCGQSSSTNEDARTSRLELQNTKTIFSGEYLDEITSEMVEDFKSARKHEVRRKAKESRLVTGTTVNRALETHYNRSSELMRIIRKLLKRVVRPERFELPTLWFEARCSIQLSYGRVQDGARSLRTWLIVCNDNLRSDWIGGTRHSLGNDLHCAVPRWSYESSRQL